jgi:hypothetical protein
MAKAEDYRKRAKGLGVRLSKTNKAGRGSMGTKQKALLDLADNEDWLEGKPPRRLTTAACNQQAENCRGLSKEVMTPSHRIMLEHIAATWERIASEIEQRNR